MTNYDIWKLDNGEPTKCVECCEAGLGDNDYYLCNNCYVDISEADIKDSIACVGPVVSMVYKDLLRSHGPISEHQKDDVIILIEELIDEEDWD